MTASVFEFPVLALGPDRYTGRPPDNERFYVFRDETALSTATREELASGARLKALLIDNAGMVRSITRISDLGPRTPLWHRVLMLVANQADLIKQKLDCEFAELPPISFDDVKARVWASIERNKDDWIDDESMAGEAGEPMALEDVIAAAKAAVDRATNVKELFENLDAAWPY